MAKEELPKMGDVIMSPRFAFGRREHGQAIIMVDGKTKKYPSLQTVGEEERVARAAQTGKIPPKQKEMDLGAYDHSRAQAKFVVEKAGLQGGGSAHGSNDRFFDGWLVQARRLREDGSYDPKGETIEFYVSGSFSNKVEQKDIRIVSKMQQLFV